MGILTFISLIANNKLLQIMCIHFTYNGGGKRYIIEIYIRTLLVSRINE